MTDTHAPDTPMPGDRIIFERPDSRHNVIQIGASGERVTVREGLKSFNEAREIAQSHLETGGRVRVEHHATQGRFKRLSAFLN